MGRYDGYEAIRFERLGDVLRVTLANPRNPLNAVDGEMHAELMRLFDDLRGERDARAVVLTGHTHHGRAFLGLDELKIVAPVACGDTIRAQVTVESVRLSDSREGHGVMTLRHRVINQDDAEVMSYKTARLMECRPA